VNCWFRDNYEKEYNAQAFLGNINRWLQEQVANYYSPSDTVCSAWNAQAASLAPPLALLPCNPRCNGDFPVPGPANMQFSPCRLASGHISLTPVQASSFAYQQRYTTGVTIWTQNKEKGKGNAWEPSVETSSAAQERTLFTEAHWRAADDASGACGACSGGACLKLQTVHKTGSCSRFVCADLPAQKQANVFGTQEYLSLSGGQLKTEFNLWQARSRC